MLSRFNFDLISIQLQKSLSFIERSGFENNNKMNVFEKSFDKKKKRGESEEEREGRSCIDVAM